MKLLESVYRVWRQAVTKVKLKASKDEILKEETIYLKAASFQRSTTHSHTPNGKLKIKTI